MQSQQPYSKLGGREDRTIAWKLEGQLVRRTKSSRNNKGLNTVEEEKLLLKVAL